MTKRQLIATTIIAISIVVLSIIFTVASIRNHQIDAEINAQSEIDATKIKEAAKLERTRERMNWVPWYDGVKKEIRSGMIPIR